MQQREFNYFLRILIIIVVNYFVIFNYLCYLFFYKSYILF
jgi:hypothetical protein